MREILLRGKIFHDSVRGELSEGESDFVIGYFFKGRNDDCYIISTTIKDKFGTFPTLRVIPSTVGQYTGLEDCEGKMIFEGDIMDATKYPDDTPCPYEILFNDGGFKRRYLSDKKTLHSFDKATISLLEDKIIANIHDNHELLEEAC